MSVENLKEYSRRCATEPELREKAKAIGMTDMDEHILHATSIGLEWSAADLLAYRREVIDAEDDDFADLTAEELEQVAGGAFSVTIAVGVGVGVGVGAGVAAAGASAAAGGAAAAGDGGW